MQSCPPTLSRSKVSLLSKESAMSGSGDSGSQMSQESNTVQDLPFKYEKLAAEYAKIKAQAIVLKKAVLEEQKQNGDLKQTLRSQEQRGKKHDSASSSVPEYNGVLDEDFKRLIQENVKLHTTVQAKEDEQYALNEQMDKLRRDLRESQHECKKADDKYQPIISKLEREKSEKEAKLKTLESMADSLKSLQSKYNKLEANYKQLEYFADNLSKHFALDGLNSMQLNNVNLSDACEQYLYKCIVDIITALTSFFSQLRNRLSYLSDITFQNKFSKIQTLCEHGKNIIQKYISKSSLDAVSIVEYRNLLDALLDDIKTLHRTQHSNLPSNLIDFISHLIRIFNVLPHLFIDKTKIYISNNALSKVISELVIFEQLAKMLKSIFRNETEMELKSNLRNMEELTSVNDCFLESLATLENCIQVLGNSLTQLLLGLNQPTENQNIHSTIIEFSRKASAHIVSHQTSLLTHSSTHEKYTLQTEELAELKAVHEQQVTAFQNQLTELEKEKLAWQTRYEALALKVESNAERSAGAAVKSESNGESVHAGESNSHATSENTQAAGDAGSGVLHKLAAYYAGKLNALVEEKQRAEGKACLIRSECTALHRRLEYLADSEHELTETMVKWKQYAAQLKDELRSTTDSYETQLSVLSEHLVELNMDLNDKREAIEELNAQLSNKGAKSKSKS
ncbi:hypothetical protein M8J75_004440 [Diaphorina citri]|nr:hypothetical protein M8J75_004440 [Diaphorina citri]